MGVRAEAATFVLLGSLATAFIAQGSRMGTSRARVIFCFEVAGNLFQGFAGQSG